MYMYKHWSILYRGTYIGVSILSCFLFGPMFGLDWKRSLDLYIGPINIEIIWGSKD